MDLAQFYSSPENKRLHVNPCEGAYCGYDGCYYRVRVMKFSQPLGLYFHHMEQARVRLLDVGCVHVVDVNQLLTLPDHFVRIPVQVVEVYVCGVRPCDRDQDWPEELVCYSREMLHHKVLDGRVALSCGETLWLDPVEHRVTLKGINVTTALSNPQKQFVKSGLAEPNPDHLAQLVQTLGIEVSQLQQLSDTVSSYVSLPVDCNVEVIVSAVSSPALFYVQLSEHEESLEALEEKLNTDCTSLMSLTGVGEGSYCVARFPLDSRWYRGLVVTVERYQSEVFFLDHGDTEWVPNNMVQPIDPSLLSFPFQAVECSLKADGVTWSPEAGDLLWEWTREQVLLVKVVDTCSSKLLECIHHVVELYLSGDSMAHRLPRVGPPSQHLAKKEEPSPGSLLEPHISALLSSKGEDRVHVAMETQSVVVKNPRVKVTPEELASMCQLVPQVTEPTCILLLRTLSCLAAFQQGVCECLAEEQCLKHILPLIKSHSLQVLELEFILLRILLPNAHSHEVLCSSDCVTSLCSCLRRKPSMKIVGHVLDILSIILEEDRRLCKDVYQAGCIPQLCQLVSKSPTQHSSCLRILVAMVTKTEGVTDVRKHLPIDSLCKLLNSEPEVQVVRSVVQILQPLCTDPSYRQQLLSSPLPRAIQRLSYNSAINCLLLQDLSALDLWPSASTCDSPPPLIYDDVEDTTTAAVCSAAPAANGPSPSLNAANMKEHVSHPRVLWSQSRSHVLLAVQLRGCKQKEVKLGPKSVELWACVPPQSYGFILTLYKDIDPQACSDEVMGSEVLIRLAKIQHVLWPRLTELKQKPAFVSVDFDRWNDSSSEVEEDPDHAKSKKSVHVRKQLPNKPQLYKDFLLPEQDTSSSSEDSSSDLDI